MAPRDRRARIEDVHAAALALPGVSVIDGSSGNPVYQVRGKSFIFFRTPRPDAIDSVTGERLVDVIVFWVATEADKHSMIDDPSTPFFTTPHFDGHLSVLLQASRIRELRSREIIELVEEAWLSRAPKRLAAAWVTANPAANESHPPIRV
jgi:hypothetical protein